MKRTQWILSAAAGVALLASCSQPSRQYTITGVLGEDVEGLTVVNLSSQDGQVMMTDSLRDGGTFSFTGMADSLPGVGRVMADRAHRATIFLEPGEIHVDLTQRRATGTPLNDEYAAFADQIEAADADQVDTDSLAGVLARDIYLRHKEDALGFMMFQEMAYTLSADELKEMLADAPERIKNEPYYEQMLGLKLAEQQTAPGTHYLDVAGIDAVASEQADKTVEPTGPELTLSTFADNGKPTLVDFWASWCGPCRAEIPHIAEAAAKYDGQINVVGIAVWDQLIDTKRAMGDLNITWPVIFSSRATEAYGIQGIPHIMLIGTDGTILERNLRGEGIAKAIDRALAAQAE
jgi:thiol-disulfide isomerase/thioredoxin